MNSLSHAELAALAKAATNLAADAPVDAGVHPVNFTIELSVSGAVKKLEDDEYTPAPKLDPAALMALVLAKAGLSRADAAKALGKAVEDAANGKGPATAAKDRLSDASEAVAKLVAALKAKAPKSPRKGSLTATVAVEVSEVRRNGSAAA